MLITQTLRLIYAFLQLNQEINPQINCFLNSNMQLKLHGQNTIDGQTKHHNQMLFRKVCCNK